MPHRARLQADELRRDFDRSFAEAPRGDVEGWEALVALRVGGDAYALRLSELAGLHHDRVVVPVFGVGTPLLGLSSLRGVLLPVYDLRALLGYPASDPAPRWLALARSPSPVALAFDVFESHLRVRPGEVSAAGDPSARRHTRGAIRVGEQTRPLLRVESLLAEIARLAQAPGVEDR